MLYPVSGICVQKFLIPSHRVPCELPVREACSESEASAERVGGSKLLQAKGLEIVGKTRSRPGIQLPAAESRPSYLI